ncbi:hypothetical protein A5877_000398, partial [Enterococcus sp. 3C7_DIV0644]
CYFFSFLNLLRSLLFLTVFAATTLDSNPSPSTLSVAFLAALYFTADFKILI